MIRQLLWFLLFLPLQLSTVIRAADTDIPFPDPEQQPLLVIKANKPDVIPRLTETRQGRALGVEDAIFSGRVPGLDSRLVSFRDFLAALSEERGQNFWYCLIGGSLLGATNAAIGCEWRNDADNDSLRKWLDDFFPGNTLALQISPVSTERQRWTAASDAKILSSLVQNRGRGTDPWRAELRRFLSNDSDNLGIWLNPRPLVGMTALTLGIDLRGELARYGLTAPESIELLLAAGLDLSLTFRLSCLFGKDWHLPKAPAMLVENANPSLLRINVPRPMHILERLSADKTSLFLANVNIRDLSPQAACFDLWRDRNGQFDWTLVCHMSNKARFEKQYSRLLAWLEILGSSPVSGLTMTKTSARGIPMRRFEYKNLSVAACLLDGEADGAYLVLAGSENLIPERDDLRLVKGNRTLMAAWQIDLDGTATELLAKRLSRMMREHGLRNVEVDLLRSLVRQGDLGEARRDGDALVLSSQRSASLLVFAGLAGLFGDWLAQFDE